MTTWHRPILGAMAAGALALAAAAPAQSQPDQSGVRVGVLTCHRAAGWGMIVGSSRQVRCSFEHDGRVVGYYRGHIDKLGVDVGYQDRGTLVWAVFAPTNGPPHGSLNGRYGGVTAGASLGAGAAANVLVGGFDRSISLQPLSVEGTTGVNLAAGVAGMTLHSAPA